MAPRRRAPAANVMSSRESAGNGWQVALLRGINVGRAKRVAMVDLRALVAELGYGDVRTLLNSGNVVFTAPGVDPRQAAARIEQGLAARLGVEARVMALSGAELETVVAENPWRAAIDNPSRLLVAVLGDADGVARLEPLVRQDWGTSRLALGAHAAYVWCPDGVLESRLPEALGKVMGDAVTTRNWATMTKLHALAVGARAT